jgi:hypothetical protein
VPSFVPDTMFTFVLAMGACALNWPMPNTWNAVKTATPLSDFVLNV